MYNTFLFTLSFLFCVKGIIFPCIKRIIFPYVKGIKFRGNGRFPLRKSILPGNKTSQRESKFTSDLVTL